MPRLVISRASLASSAARGTQRGLGLRGLAPPSLEAAQGEELGVEGPAFLSPDLETGRGGLGARSTVLEHRHVRGQGPDEARGLGQRAGRQGDRAHQGHQHRRHRALAESQRHADRERRDDQRGQQPPAEHQRQGEQQQGQRRRLPARGGAGEEVVEVVQEEADPAHEEEQHPQAAR